MMDRDKDHLFSKLCNVNTQDAVTPQTDTIRGSMLLVHFAIPAPRILCTGRETRETPPSFTVAQSILGSQWSVARDSLARAVTGTTHFLSRCVQSLEMLTHAFPLRELLPQRCRRVGTLGNDKGIGRHASRKSEVILRTIGNEGERYAYGQGIGLRRPTTARLTGCVSHFGSSVQVRVCLHWPKRTMPSTCPSPRCKLVEIKLWVAGAVVFRLRRSGASHHLRQSYSPPMSQTCLE